MEDSQYESSLPIADQAVKNPQHLTAAVLLPKKSGAMLVLAVTGAEVPRLSKSPSKAENGSWPTWGVMLLEYSTNPKSLNKVLA